MILPLAAELISESDKKDTDTPAVVGDGKVSFIVTGSIVQYTVK